MTVGEVGSSHKNHATSPQKNCVTSNKFEVNLLPTYLPTYLTEVTVVTVVTVGTLLSSDKNHATSPQKKQKIYFFIYFSFTFSVALKRAI